MKTLIVLQFSCLTIAGIGVSIYLVHRRVYNQGVVEGILYAPESPSVMVDRTMLKEGDTIYGVKVTKIHPNKVEFEKDGMRWVQRVRERPNPVWKEPEMPNGSLTEAR